MIIGLITEPRSGSTNLANWFYKHSEFTILFEPYNPMSKWYIKDTPISEFKYNTKHLLVKDVYYPEFTLNNPYELYDKIIILYREDVDLQMESFINAFITNNWDKEYVYVEKNSKIVDEKSLYFLELKRKFKEKYIEDTDYFKISYEELYYKGGFKKIVDYLQIDCVKNENFPYGKKYRINVDKPKKLI